MNNIDDDHFVFTKEMSEVITLQRVARQFHGDWDLAILWLREQATMDPAFQPDLKRALRMKVRDQKKQLLDQLVCGEIIELMDFLNAKNLIQLREYGELLAAKQNEEIE